MSIGRAMIAMVLVVAACTSDDRAGDVALTASPAPASVAPTSPSATSSLDPTTEPTGTTPAPSDVTPARRAELLCARTGVEVVGQVAAASLDEVSGVVSSRTHPGVLWAHNDGPEQPGVHAIGPGGADLGFHPLPAPTVDVEDLAIATLVSGDELYLGDIGDNLESRSTVSVFRFPEPDPAAPGPIADVRRYDFVYPDRPHNAEALLVDEANERVVIVTKEQASGPDGRPDPLGATETSLVFEGRLDAPDSTPTELTAVGTVDTEFLEDRVDNPTLHPATLAGIGGVVTGGDVSADGTLVALRTYEAVWLWPRRAGQRVAEVFGAVPCQVRAAPEVQGEAVAFAADGLVTIAEGVRPPIHLLGR